MADSTKTVPKLILVVSNVKRSLFHEVAWQANAKSLTVSSKEVNLIPALTVGADIVVATRVRDKNGFTTTTTEGIIKSVTPSDTGIVVLIDDEPESSDNTQEK